MRWWLLWHCKLNGMCKMSLFMVLLFKLLLIYSLNCNGGSSSNCSLCDSSFRKLNLSTYKCECFEGYFDIEN